MRKLSQFLREDGMGEEVVDRSLGLSEVREHLVGALEMVRDVDSAQGVESRW